MSCQVLLCILLPRTTVAQTGPAAAVSSPAASHRHQLHPEKLEITRKTKQVIDVCMCVTASVYIYICIIAYCFACESICVCMCVNASALLATQISIHYSE